MIQTIRREVCLAITEAFDCALHTNPGSFVLFLARGNLNPQFDTERFAGITPYCLNYMQDAYMDETRDMFYIHYLNRRYRHDDFKYQGEDGLDDLCVEMMIYSHVWESEAFLKNLYRLSNIVSGQEFYDWDVSRIKFHGHSIISDTKERFKEHCPQLYTIIDKSYSGYIRDSFAHMLFNINEYNRIINLYSDRVKDDRERSQLSFDDFQTKFLYTVELCYELSKIFRDVQKELISDVALLSQPISLPDGKSLLITEAKMLHEEPRFTAVILSDSDF